MDFYLQKIGEEEEREGSGKEERKIKERGRNLNGCCFWRIYFCASEGENQWEINTKVSLLDLEDTCPRYRDRTPKIL